MRLNLGIFYDIAQWAWNWISHDLFLRYHFKIHGLAVQPIKYPQAWLGHFRKGNSNENTVITCYRYLDHMNGQGNIGLHAKETRSGNRSGQPPPTHTTPNTHRHQRKCYHGTSNSGLANLTIFSGDFWTPMKHKNGYVVRILHDTVCE